MLLQLVVSGLALGAIYALVALSMTVVYRATTVVNFGHGDLVMCGAFIVYVMVVYAAIPYAPAAIIALGLLFGLGMLIQHGLIQRIMSGPHLAMAMMAIAIGYFLRGGARVLWGREVLPFPAVFPVHSFSIGNIVVTSDDLIITGLVLALMMAFFGVFHLTRLGKLIQAVYQSQRGAALIGLNVSAFHNVMWGVGAAMGALGGVLIAPITLLYPDMGAHLLIRGFAAMTLGGFGSLWGAVAGGLLLGVTEHLCGAYIATALIDITAYLVIILVLIVKPTGLFGRQAVVRL